MQAAAPTAAEVREALTRVLTRPEFADAPATGLAAWLARMREALRAAYMSLLERLNLLDAGSDLLLRVLWFWLAVTALLLVAHVVTSLAGVRRGRERTSPRARSRGAAVRGGPVDWLAAAERAAEEGRFRDAVLAVYQALLERLQRQGLIRYDAAKTPGDYRRELRGNPQPARGLERFLQHFEPVAFGGREPDRAAFDRLRTLGREAVGE
jgi:hypothetical protein